MKEKNVRLCFAGDGWGAVAALKSLVVIFDEIIVSTADEDVEKICLDNDLIINKCLDNVVADIYIFAGYKPIISAEFLSKRNVINIHYSLLPKYRGMHSTVWGILNGESKLGLTIHKMNENIDDGEIIVQYEIDYIDQNSSEIMENCNNYIQHNLGQIVLDYLDGKLNTFKQDFSLATWVCKRNYDDCIIDFNWNAVFMKRFFKALVSPYPLPRIQYKEKIYAVSKFEIIERSYYMTNGRVVNIDDNGAWVKIFDGFLIVKELIEIDSGKNLLPQNIFKIGARLQ